MSGHINDLADGSVYLDTMVFYANLRMHSADVARLFQRIEDGVLQAFTSSLTFDEVAYRLLLGLIRDKYGKSPLDRLRQEQRLTSSTLSLSHSLWLCNTSPTSRLFRSPQQIVL